MSKHILLAGLLTLGLAATVSARVAAPAHPVVRMAGTDAVEVSSWVSSPRGGRRSAGQRRPAQSMTACRAPRWKPDPPRPAGSGRQRPCMPAAERWKNVVSCLIVRGPATRATASSSGSSRCQPQFPPSSSSLGKDTLSQCPFDRLQAQMRKPFRAQLISIRLFFNYLFGLRSNKQIECGRFASLNSR